MPQMNKGGKFIFGKSVIQEDGRVRIPPQAAEEYRMALEERAYLFTGSKSTGGFCVTRKGLLEPSKLGHILTTLPRCGTARRGPESFSGTRGGPTAGWTSLRRA